MNNQQYLVVLLIAVSLYGGAAWAQQEMPRHELHPMTMMGGGYDTEMSAKSVLLGEQTVNGMTALAYIQDVSALMAKMGRKENTRFIVMFTEQSSGAAVLADQTVLKIVAASEQQIGQIVKLAGVDEHFEANVVLPGQGSLRLEVECIDQTGQTRPFTFLLKR